VGNFLVRSAAVGLVAGGFAFTGDLGWLADRGRRLLEARDVPAATAPGSPAPAPSLGPAAAYPALPLPAFAPTPPHAAAPLPPPPPTPATPAASPAPAAAPAPARSPVVEPPADGPDRLAFRPLPPGSRVVVWIAPAGHAGRPIRLIFDLVDPTTGEAIVSEQAGTSPAAPARRVTLRTDAAEGVLVRGGSIHLAGTGLAGADAGVWLGPIAAIEPVD